MRNLIRKVKEMVQRTQPTADLVKRWSPGETLLDIGCGNGLLLAKLAKKYKVVGIDKSKLALSKASQLIDKDRLKCLDFERESPGGVYEVVLAFNVLEHLHRPMAALVTIAKLTKQDGIFIFSVPNNFGVVGKIATAVLNFVDRTHVSTLPRQEWFRGLEKNGFKTVAVFNSVIGTHQRADWMKHLASSFIVVARKAR